MGVRRARGRGAAFVIGAGVGYFLGTRPGRAVVDQAKVRAGDVWRDPRLQAYVKDLEAQALAFAKEQGVALKDRVVDAATGAAAGRTADAPIEDEIVLEPLDYDEPTVHRHDR